jgi:hypothetical protein
MPASSSWVEWGGVRNVAQVNRREAPQSKEFILDADAFSNLNPQSLPRMVRSMLRCRRPRTRSRLETRPGRHEKILNARICQFM